MSQAPEPPARHRGVRAPVLCAVLALSTALGAAWAVPAALAERPAGDGRAALSPTATDPGGLPGVLTTATSAQETTAAEAAGVQQVLEEHLGEVPGQVSATVLDARTGQVLGERTADEPRIPASNQKVLTALAIARELEPYHRLATTVVAGERPGQIVLVAGGDTLLAPGAGDPRQVNGHAGVADLAQSTARALQEQEVRGRVTVDLDTSLFTGPDTNPAWAEEDIAAGEITAVAPVAFYSHRVPTPEGADPGDRGTRPRDAAASVAQVFREQLQEELGAGFTVTTGDRGKAPENARELARVESAPIHEQTAYMLQHSDNSLAETLARMAARETGQPAGVRGVQTVIRASLDAQHAADPGTVVVDASGMAVADQVTTRTLARAVRALATDPAFGPYAQGLPLGGASGTLQDRFDDPQERAARGLTRAKTGTLNSVVSLSGYVQRADGTVLVYSLVCNDVDGHIGPTKDAVDRAVAALAQG